MQFNEPYFGLVDARTSVYEKDLPVTGIYSGEEGQLSIDFVTGEYAGLLASEFKLNSDSLFFL